MYSQCESGDYGFSVQSTPQRLGEYNPSSLLSYYKKGQRIPDASYLFFSSNQDAFNEWIFGKRFKEDCLVLDSFVALPLAAKLSMAAVPGN